MTISNLNTLPGMGTEYNLPYLNSASTLAKEIGRIKKDSAEKRMRGKENFNFFTAIVSGKSDKVHIEKYHSNFLAYLLDPHGMHDFGGLFLKEFFKIIGERNNELPDEKSLRLEREKPANGRFIDIVLENSDWIVFIENKILFNEQPNQMSDYFEFAREKYKKGIGIYLTLNGGAPPSMNGQKPANENFQIILLSYKEIIKWLQYCSEVEEIKEHKHILVFLEQYISIIIKLTKSMNEEARSIRKELMENKAKTLEIVKNWGYFSMSIETIVKEVRDKFKNDLEQKVNEELNADRGIPDNFSVEILQGAYLFNGDEDDGDCYFGLGFVVKKDNQWYNYGGKGHGGHGNGITLNNISSEGSDVDKANALLLEAQDNDSQWEEIIESTANNIVEEVKRIFD
ncbi:MAG: PD-(D/E)XK nuclease family protein [Chitinophagaceae bacterium]|nr:PD-(D/E)XK nuclease family protein [Chitinophagaceae bacterium]